MRKLTGTAIAAMLVAGALSAASVTTHPKATDEALINPDMGFVYYKYSNRLWAYGINTPENDTLDWFPGCSTVYLRVLWNDIEPEEGEYRWDIFDSAAQNWIAKGKKIALRIICCNQTETATPQFVRDAGAKGFWFEYKTDTTAGGKLPPRWEPIYDDPVFLAKLENFIKAFAKRYDGDPNVAFVDVGSFGIYGEGHLYNTSQQRLSEPEHRAEFVRLAKIHLDLWKRLMPNTYLVVSDDIDGGWNPEEDPEMMRYCREIGIGFRDDSIFCFPPPGTKPNCPFSYWAHDGWARKFAPKWPVVVETGHSPHLFGSPKWDNDAYVRCVEAYQASYMSIHDFPDVHLRECRAEIDRINKILGYRFELREVTYPTEVKVGEKVEIGSTWVNVGVAPKTKSAALAWSLLNPDGTVAWCATDNAFDFKSLEPKLKGVEKSRKVATPCRFGYSKRIPEPDNCVVWARAAGRKFPEIFAPLKPGEYTLAVSVGSWQGTPEIALPLGGHVGTTRRYEIGKIRVVSAGKDADAPLSLHRFDAGKGAPKVFYNAYRPIEAGSQSEIAIVSIHGWGGGVRSVLPDFTKALAARSGSDERTPYVIAPLFPRRETRAANGEPEEGCAVWCDSRNDGKDYPGRLGSAVDDWRGGGDANGTSFSSFDYIDAIFARFADRAKYPNLRKVVLLGFSAGGQLTGRYVATGKGVVRDGVKVVYVVIAPSVELLFDPELPWHYGLKGRPRYSASITEDEIMKNLCSRHVWRGCGSLDNFETPKGAFRDKLPHTVEQGANRLERFKYFERYIDKYPEWKKCVSFHVIEGAAHKTLPCYLEPALLDFLFE